MRDAPTFAEVAADLANHLAGRVVVAHNLTFDLRFLIAEYANLGAQVPLDVDHGLCTMRLSGRYLSSPARSLAACCGSAGIDHSELHSALYDARACAELLTYCLRAAGRPEPWAELSSRVRQHQWPALSAGGGRICRRRATGDRPPTFLARLIDRLPRVPQPARADDCLALLDRALLDRQLSASEQDALIEAADGIGLTFADMMELHRSYLAALAAAAWQDGVITETERRDLLDVAELLGLAAQDVDIVLSKAKSGFDIEPHHQFHLVPGDVVVFTGQFPRPREQWERHAANRGLKVADNVTRTARIVVAADPDSLSGKAKKARRYGIPIIAVTAFDRLLNEMRDHP